ncbi:Ig-like domain repeat protein [Paracidobacterium acidisoli]|nr:Ig-like domain repeat protein [Paracidobacterium acidisoli]MBT9331512.1 Ig-like domain repeat protein [Paracidobacterium acidisoli]
MAQTPAPRVTFLPGTQSTAATGFFDPEGVAVDSSGNLYITDSDGYAPPSYLYKETLSGGTYTRTVIASGFTDAWGVAVDSSGNVYVTDYGDDGGSVSAVYKETLSGGSYTQTTIASGFKDADGVAIDSSGNLYIADFGCPSCTPATTGGLYKETLSGGSYTQSTIASGLDVSGVALDSSGNLYITVWTGFESSGALYKETLSGGSYTQSTIATNFITPESVVVEPSGNLYVTDDNMISGSGAAVYKETLSGGSYTQSTLISNLYSPEALVLDESGNLYVAAITSANSGVPTAGAVYKEDYADPPSLSFASTNVGSTSSTQTVTVNNIGNAALEFEIPGSGNNPNISTGFTLASGSGNECPLVTSASSTAGVLNSGASCTLPVAFAPEATGSYSSSTLVLTDNSGNQTSPYATQTINLSGTGTGTDKASSFTVTGSSPVIAGTASSITVRAYDSVGNLDAAYRGTVHFTSSDTGSGVTVPADYTFTSGDNGQHTFTNGVTLVTTGSQTVTATDTSTATVTGSAVITVDAGTVTRLGVSAPSSATVGTPFSITVFAYDAYGNFASGYSGTVHFTSTDGAASLPANSTLTNGEGTFTVTFNTAGSQTIMATDTSNASIRGTSGAITLGQAPAITSAAGNTFTVGTAGSFTVTASGSPAPTFSESGALPSGITLTSSGVLSGTPAAGTGGIYGIIITASNGIGSNAVQSFTLTVDQSPTITSAGTTTFTAGTPGAFVVTATGNPRASLIESGALPSGVTFIDNGNGTATLSGMPAAGTGGNYPITITANNGISPNGTQSFMLSVDQASAITSANNTTFAVGTPGSFTVTTSANPRASLSESGALPSGVTFIDNGNGTATLSGMPAAGAGGIYAITITASNGIGPNAAQSFTLTVGQAPAITSPVSTTFTTGVPGAFTIAATGYPTAVLSESGALPGGVTFTSNANGTATLAGTPAAGSANTYPLTVMASNGVNPTATQSFTLTVLPPPGFVVTTATDDATGTASNCTPGGSDCSLRDALAASATVGGQITFSPTVFAAGNTAAANTITLTNGTLNIPSNTTITGATSGSGATLANLVTISGGGSSSNFSIFAVNSGVTGAGISNLTIANGHVDSQGGAISNLGSLAVSDCTFSGNYAAGGAGSGNGGGAVYTLGTLTVAGSTFSGNSSAPGGAISVGAGAVTIDSSTFTGNTVLGGYAGGAMFLNAGTIVTITNSTLSGNSAGAGEAGGIFNYGTLVAVNSIFSGNTGGDCSAGGSSACPTNGSNGNIVGGAVDLAPPGNYGGPTETMIPLPGSPAICGGAVTADTTDQRGYSRSTGSCYDVGAVQTQYSIAFVQQPSAVVQSAVMTPAVTVTVLDHGNGIPGAAVNLTLSGPGSLGGTLSQATDPAGTATFANLNVSAPGTDDTLTASSGGTLTVKSDTFNVNSAVTQLAFSTVPVATLTAGGNAGTSVTVQEEGASGATVTTASGTITLTVTGPGSYSKSYTETAVNGTAIFNLSGAALTAAGSYSYTASIAGSPSVAAATASETVSASSVASVGVVSGSNQNAVIGAAFALPLKVKVEDQYGNPVSGAAVAFAAPSSGASALLSAAAATVTDGTTSVTATANGKASTTAYTVTASESGATSASFTLTNTQDATALTVTPSPSAPVYGQPVTITSSISPGTVAGSTPTGMVQFYDGATALMPTSNVATASASYTVSVATVGSHPYKAQYLGDNNFLASALTSATAALVVSKASSTLQGPATGPGFVYGAGGTISVTVSGQYTGAGVAQPSGSVSYAIDGGTAQTASISGGKAVLTIPAAEAVSGHTVMVNYSGDGNYNAAAQIQIGFTVTGAALTISANNATRVYGVANPPFTGAVTGEQNGDTFVESFTTAAALSSPVGDYAIVPSVTGANLSDYTQSIVDGTLTVTQAGTVTNLGVSSATITPGQSETLTATVSSKTTGTPGGTVSFYDGTALLSTVSLSGGAASYSTATLAPGVIHTITAAYSGDSNFTASSSTASATVTVASLDFTMTVAGPSSKTVVPGSEITYQVTVTPDYGSYAGTVNFQISGLPPGATATFSPSSIPASGGPQTVTVTIQTARTTALDRPPVRPGSRPMQGGGVALAALGLLGLGGLRRRRRALKRFLCVAVLVAGAAATTLSLSGCGSTGFFAQAEQNYSITVTATAGSLQHSATVMLNVQ